MGDENVSTKMKGSDRDRATELARTFNVNGMIVIKAWRREFDKLPFGRQQKAIQGAQRLHPSSRPPRIGRGNRHPVPVAP